METTEVARRIDHALALEDPDASISGVKAAVISEFRRLDPNSRIKTTEYFNHSYVPDLVVSWPSAPGAEERYIYLKFNTELDYLFDDLTLVKDKEPIVFGLGPTPRHEKASLQRLTNASVESNTLLTDPGGVDVLVQGRSNRFFELVTSALAKGGRGLLDQPAAWETTQSLNSGFEGARHIERSLTSRAATAIETYLDRSHASPLMRLLEAVWVGSGGRLEEFPGQHDVAGDIADDALQFLLQLEPVEDAEFWRRVAKRVSFDQLVRLELPYGSSNLDKLMLVNAVIYSARYCRLRPEHRNLFDADRPPVFWFVDRRVLGLKGYGFAAYISDHIEDLRGISQRRASGLPLQHLLRRAEGQNLTELELHSGTRAIRYSSHDTTSVAKDQALLDLQRSLGKSPTVRSAAVAMPSGKTLYCDFVLRTARGAPNTTFQLRQLLGAAVSLFTELDSAEVDALDEIIRPNDGQPSL